ncbi:hypothetical protein SynA1562_00835 [Synechococcus sp. A15-62]|nr:hypothetical protein SynA1562_00835 [Synechococcus sp. A15-62]
MGIYLSKSIQQVWGLIPHGCNSSRAKLLAPILKSKTFDSSE